MGPRARPAVWLALLGAAVVFLRLSATGDLSPPPLSAGAALDTWVGSRSPAVAALALVRLVAEMAAWYLLLVSLLHVVGTLLRAEVLHVLADAVALPAARRLVHAALGIGLTIVPAEAVDGWAGRTTIAAAAPTDDRVAAPGQRRADRGTASMRPVGARAGTATGTAARAGTARMVPTERAGAVHTAEEAPVRAPSTWLVEEGDSFWSIATEVLRTAWGREPSEEEVGPFWRRTVDVNRSRLVVEGDPDLVLPGQVFDLPPVPELR